MGQLELDFSVERGFYNNPFSVLITSPEPGVTIKYTTNGKTPSQSVGTTYTGAVNISTTTVLKAFAYNSVETSNVKAHSYIFIDDVINQPITTANFPASTGFSSSIKNDNTYGPQLDDALESIPFISLSLDITDYNFIYTNKGISKQAYVEFYDLSSGDTYGRPVGVSTYGNTSFSAADADKKNYRLRFKEEFGASKFKYDIFGEGAADEYDVFDLRAGSQATLDRGGVQNIHEKFLKDLQIQTSGEGVHGRFLHVFINGVYWGVYTASERPAKAFGEAYFGGDKDNYNTIKATCCNSNELAIDGTITSYNQMKNAVSNYPAVEANLDVANFIDYVMICNYGPHGDWRTWNTYAIDNPIAGVPFKFFVWDVEPSLYNDWYYTDVIVDTRDHESIWQPLKNNVDFRMRVADHFECNCEESDGPLNPTNAEAYYDELFQANKLAYMAEAARWADKNLYDDFLDYRDDLLSTNWFSNRMAAMKNAYELEDLYPSIDAVQFSQNGGIVNSGFQVSLTNPNNNGTIYYTLDGSDPRANGGSVSSSAMAYSNSISLSAGVYTITARVKNGSEWSAMCPKRFYVDQQYQNLVINEIHYNPYDVELLPDTISGKNFEFVEIKNCGSTQINLIDLEFTKGITLKIETDLIIQPNQFLVFADDREWFQYQNGFYPDGEYIGKLDNGGENIWLLDPEENIVDSLRYNDKDPWPATADKGYYSLALKECSTDNAQGGNWSIQSVFTTPRAENYFTNFGEHSYSGIVINEIHYNPKDEINNQVSPPDTTAGTKFEFVEIKNIGAVQIDLTDVVFSRGIDYEFDDGVTINPGDFIVLAEDKSSFLDRYGFQPFDKYDGKLSNNGETIWLQRITSTGPVMLDAVSYSPSFPWDSQANGGNIDYSLALIDGDVDNDTYLNWQVQCNSLYTPGAENDLSCFNGLNYDGLMITEFHYSPSQGNNYEFLEIQNKSNTILNLDEVRLASGVSYIFDNRIIVPNQTLILARDSVLFENTYGLIPHGQYTGGLSSGGETILIKDLFNETIDSVKYGVSSPWSSEPLQGIKSLALLDTNLDNSLAENWCVQDPDITPGSANVFADNDNDSIADCIDSCLGFDNNLIGSTCEDGDPCTTGETYNSSCQCTGGIFQDSDNDGVCDANDECGGFDDNLIGTPCSDGDACTVGETYDSNCTCSGGSFQDSDSDGVCDANDACPGANDGLIGLNCSDGDPCTIGSTYDANCNCTGGIFQDADGDGVCDANDSCPGQDDNLIGTVCSDGDACTIGETYDSNCNCSGGVFQDSDNDGICDANDMCNGQDDNLIGTTCNDGDPCTAGETYDSNCNCTNGIFQDSDGDGICNANDQCPNFNDLLIGQPCNDGDDCTIGESYQSDCSCAGGALLDSNSNGICDLIDSGCDVLYLDDFEANSGIWQSGGSDAFRTMNGNSPDGSYSFLIRDNSSLGSSVYSSILDFSNEEIVKIRFQFQAISMDANESFELQLSTDGGATFTTKKTWMSGIDFMNNIIYAEDLNVTAADLSSAVVIRFECKASINSDQVFIDNIVLESCMSCTDYVNDFNYRDINYDTSAMISIQSNGTIKSPHVVDFHAGEFIMLDKSFEVEMGAVFHAFISPCN